MTAQPDLWGDVWTFAEWVQDPRLANVDIIYTANSNGKAVLAHCCLAMRSGWEYGTRSSDGTCGAAHTWKKHRPVFVDNHFHAYDHAVHLGVVGHWRPRYCTVMDLMTPQQCAEQGVQWHAPGQIIEWAYELADYAERVILIPKYPAALDEIPDDPRFMLGYSVPTSYGGTPMDITMMLGRPIHLLGGSPIRQIKHWAYAPDDVVSLDNNYILKIANKGSCLFPDGRTASLSEGIGAWPLANPAYVALALSLGTMAKWFSKQPDPEDEEGTLF